MSNQFALVVQFLYLINLATPAINSLVNTLQSNKLLLLYTNFFHFCNDIIPEIKKKY